jgi:hypothetical protein
MTLYESGEGAANERKVTEGDEQKRKKKKESLAKPVKMEDRLNYGTNGLTELNMLKSNLNHN